MYNYSINLSYREKDDTTYRKELLDCFHMNTVSKVSCSLFFRISHPRDPCAASSCTDFCSVARRTRYTYKAVYTA